MPGVLQPNDGDETPQDLGDFFVLHKGSNRHVAHCAVTTHILGWECRLLIGRHLLQSKICKSPEEVFGTGEQWKAAMTEKGWT